VNRPDESALIGLAGLVLAALIAGSVAVGAPAAALLVVLTLVGLAGWSWLGSTRFALLVGSAGLVLPAVSWPSVVAPLLVVPGTGIPVSDLLLIVGAAWSAVLLPPSMRRLVVGVLVVGFALVTFALVRVALDGALSARSLDDAARFGRLFLGFAVGVAGFVHQPRWIVRGAAVVVWSGLVAVALVRLTGVPVAGVVGGVNRIGADNALVAGVQRFQIPSSQVALVWLAVAVSWTLLGGRVTRSGVPTTLAAAAVTFVGFSRNSILVLGLVVVTTLAFGGRTRSVALQRVVAGGLVAAVLLAVVPLLLPGSGFVREFSDSMSAFEDRVLVGLTSRGRSVDSSIQLRAAETTAALEAIARQPVLGAGLGVPYRGSISGGEFWRSTGRTYVHNGFLWFPIKLGVIASLLIGCLLIAAVLPALRRWTWLRSSDPLAAACLITFGALLLVTSWVPYAFDPWAGPTSSVLLAAVVVAIRTRGAEAEGPPPSAAGRRKAAVVN